MNLTKYPKIESINKCEDEPIAFYPQVQGHGCLLVTDENFVIQQASSNAEEFLGQSATDLQYCAIEQVFSKEVLQELNHWKKDPVPFKAYQLDGNHSSLLCIPGTTAVGYLLSIESNIDASEHNNFQQKILSVFGSLSQTRNLNDLTQKAAQQFKDLLSYDRVMIYQFDECWNGNVIAEVKNEELEPWLGLQYPASDIPTNARKLFHRQRVRSISNVQEDYASMIPVAHPQTNELTNISDTDLRGSSPFHIEYLNNMGVSATLSCAIILNDELWGLIACHHYSPKTMLYHTRQSCVLLADMLAAQITEKESKSYLENIEKATEVRSSIISGISQKWDLADGLTKKEGPNAMDLFPCSGFSISFDQEIRNIGQVPERAILQRIILELQDQCGEKDFYSTDCLKDVLPWINEENARKFSGVLFYKISKSKDEAAIWFRQEQIKTIEWGGNPNQGKLSNENQIRLSPRKSFDKWSEEVKFTSISWKKHEKASAMALVQDLRNLIVSKYGEISNLNRQLNSLNKELESFSYSVSHDLRGPLRGIDGFAQILMEDYADVLDEYGKESLKIIINSADKMNSLMDDILSYSGLSKTVKIDDFHDVNSLCQEIMRDNNTQKYYPNTEVSISTDIPKIYGDKAMIYQLFSNLLLNAFKYSSKSESPLIEVGYEDTDEHIVYYIKDNGIGFKEEYAQKIFGIFSRLVKDEYKGTGVGLAIVQRIVYRHNGQVWAESKEGEGATFKFYIQNPAQ
ncbi:ATP-binding protein [Nonlabens xiamenensis]|uniref:ATP-binding protein n=1 Tax=Nonlabens xiamenensis TaxID=2341043 RepID=UPI000F60CF55|nr:ATP-binding protein [Nonlabens xiamenensis]